MTRAERVAVALDHHSHDLLARASNATQTGVLEIAHLLMVMADAEAASFELSLHGIDAVAVAREARLLVLGSSLQDTANRRHVRYSQSLITILQSASQVSARRLGLNVTLDDVLIALLQSGSKDQGIVLLRRQARVTTNAQISFHSATGPLNLDDARSHSSASQQGALTYTAQDTSPVSHTALIETLSRQVRDLQSETHRLRRETESLWRERDGWQTTSVPVAALLAHEPAATTSRDSATERVKSRLSSCTRLFELAPAIALTTAQRASEFKTGRMASQHTVSSSSTSRSSQSSRTSRMRGDASYAAYATAEPTEDDVFAPRSGRTREKRFYLSPDDDIVDAPSIGHRTAERLRAAGVRKVRDLLAAQPDELAQRLNARNISAAVIIAWQHQARLVITVPWLRGTHAQLLVGAGHPSPDAIAASDQAALLAAILRFTATREGQSVLRAGPPPDADKVAAWISYAQAAEAHRASVSANSEAA